jgi:membrane-associated phospholipid phosphatase
MHSLIPRFLLVGALLTTPAVARSQDPSPSPPVATDGPVSEQPAAAPEAEDPTKAPVSALKGLLIDIGHDYTAWFTLDTTRTLMIGTASTLFLRPADEALTDRGFPVVGEGLSGGQQYGNVTVQLPVAFGWWVVGYATGNRQAGDAGRDLVRAQLNAASFTYAIKFVVRRTRPNGDPRSFPSGHASATFATATVLHRHYGWKLGLPFYLLGVYTAASRIEDKKHWLTDTAMGATVGIAAGRAVTFHLKQRPVQVTPAMLRGGIMLQFAVEP